MILSRRRRLLCLLCFLCFLCLPAGLLAPEPAVIRFAVIGDSGTGDAHQYRIAEQMVAWHDRLPYELVLMLGDNVYGAFWGGGNRKDFEEKFDRPYAELLRRGVVFRAALGNHDTRADGGRHLIEARDRFHIEGPEGYYSFTAGTQPDGAPLIEFFVINTVRLEKDKKDPEQLAWLDKALAESQARWRIVYGHHPLYSTGKRHGGDEKLREKIEPLLLRQEKPTTKPDDGASSPLPAMRRVQVVLAGHDHIYQRFHPQKGIFYFVCGSSGKLRRGDAGPSGLVAAVEDRQHVFMLWEATPAELRFRAINEQGQAFDCGVIEDSGQIEQTSCDALAGGQTLRLRPRQTRVSAPPGTSPSYFPGVAQTLLSALPPSHLTNRLD
ncbi:MAG: hypothetical protein A3D93_02255 [Acidobacteria bacterium RIFCSPHIGHO2_12_FULL_67_30]|nr:MAG: hypothetical protein A2620_06345 [Acidobacteria bacterium RIFCSPHIGHO2_01_FULL_67_28]OFV89405.1 MAG: hypothetical protein A3D93_02255 [Acidobacteria bacterium RIFCSPHIGHO2_12_FULL_67_30]